MVILSSSATEAEVALKKEIEVYYEELESHQGNLMALKKELDDVVDKGIKDVYVSLKNIVDQLEVVCQGI